MLTVAEVQALGGYDVIYLDPAWSYNDRGCNGAAAKIYETMSPAEILALPLRELAASDCAMFIWGTYPKLPEVLDTIAQWGFTFKSIAFQWIKYRGVIKASPADLRAAAAEMLQIADQIERGVMTGREDWLRLVPFLGLGRWTRGNTEPCFLAVRGKPQRVHKGVSQLIEDYFDEDQYEILRAPLTRHSAKPRVTRDKITELMGTDTSKLELFARDRAVGWDSWGDDPKIGTPDVILTVSDDYLQRLIVAGHSVESARQVVREWENTR